jgi:uncharacterized protein YjbJ (UPF0337 family)
MINDVIDGKWKELRGKIRKWQDKRSDDQLIQVNSKREQFIGILQKRYGYTQEKAVSELNRHYSKTRFV